MMWLTGFSYNSSFSSSVLHVVKLLAKHLLVYGMMLHMLNETVQVADTIVNKIIATCQIYDSDCFLHGFQYSEYFYRAMAHQL